MMFRADVVQLGEMLGATDKGMCELMAFDQVTIAKMYKFAEENDATYAQVKTFGKEVLGHEGRTPTWAKMFEIARVLGIALGGPACVTDSKPAKKTVRRSMTGTQPVLPRMEQYQENPSEFENRRWSKAAEEYRKTELGKVKVLLEQVDNPETKTTAKQRQNSLMNIWEASGNFHDHLAQQELGSDWLAFRESVEEELRQLVDQHPEIAYLFKFPSRPESHTAIEERSIARLTDSENKVTNGQNKTGIFSENVKNALSSALSHFRNQCITDVNPALYPENLNNHSTKSSSNSSAFLGAVTSLAGAATSLSTDEAFPQHPTTQTTDFSTPVYSRVSLSSEPESLYSQISHKDDPRLYEELW